MAQPATGERPAWLHKNPPCDSTDIEAGFDPDDLRRLADEGIAAAIAHACEHSPFYQKRFHAAGLQSSDVTSAQDLTMLPTTSKQDLGKGGREFWAVPSDRIADIVTTSGTTGLPTLYPLTEADITRLGYNEYLSFRCAGLSSRDVVLLAVTMDKCFMAGLAYFEGLRRIGAATVRVGSGSPMMLLSLIDRLRPTAIVSVPSFLKVVARYAAEHRVNLASSPVAKLICIGEPIRTRDVRPNPLGRGIAESWGAELFATYGVTEIASSLCECPAGAGGHLHPEILHLEILDDNGNPVPDGEIGEIVATPLGVEAMPLLRFRTGDRAFLTREPCACGLRTPRIGPILGRKNQMMKLKGTTVYPAAVQRVLHAVQSLNDYVMIVSASSELSDELEIVVAVDGDEDAACNLIRERLQGELKVTPRVRAAGADQVARLQNSPTLRKKRRFIDRRPQKP